MNVTAVLLREKAAPARVRLAGQMLLLAGCIYLLIVMYPFAGDFRPITTGIDSWPFGLNYLANSQYIAGRDWTFTYGPLGYLLFPQNIGADLFVGAGFWLALYSIFGLAAIWIVLQSKHVVQGLLFVAGYALARALGLPHGPELFLLVALLLTVSLSDLKLAIPAAVVAGILSSALVFAKLTLGLEALVMVGIACSLHLARHRQQTRCWRPVWVTATSIILASLFLSANYLRSLGGFVAWLVSSINLLRGYSVAMSVAGPDVLTLEGLLLAAAFGTAAALLWRTRDPAGTLAPAFAVVVFFLFKEGYVREDGPHLVEYFPVVAGLCAILVVASRGAAAFRLSATCLVGAICFAAVVAVQLFGAASVGDHTQRVLTGQYGLQNFQSLVHLSAIRRDLDTQSMQNLRAEQFPAQWSRLITAGHSTADAVPFDLGLIAAGDLKWIPNPTLQLYAGYTAWLDQRSGDHFLGHDGPDFLLSQFADIDGRNPLLSTPTTWRAIMDAYELASEDENAGMLLLKRRPSPTPNAQLQAYGSTRARLDSGIPIPPTDHPLYAKIDMSLSPQGELAALLFRVEPVYLELHYASGRVSSYRVTPDTMRNGVLVNYLPNSLAEFVGLLNGTAEDRIVRIRVAGPGAAAYDKDLNVTWWAASTTIKYLPETRPTPSALPRADKPTDFYVDLVNTAPASQNGSPVAVNRGASDVITVTGWAVDSATLRPAGGVFANLDGQTDVPAVYGLSRPDVGAHFKNPGYNNAGFQAALSVSDLGPGRHILSIKILSTDQSSYYWPEYRLILDVR